MTPEQATLQLPDDWQLVRVKHCLLPGSQGSKIGPFGSALKLEDLADEGIPVFGQGNVMARDYTFGKRFLTPSRFDEMRQYSVQSGDVLVTMMGSAGRCDVVPEGTGEAIIDSHLLRLRLADSVDPGFFRWFLDESLPASAQATMASKGSIMAGLNSGIVRDMWFPLAPLPTQRRIADFLDHKTAAIDALIEKKERLLALLAEKRAALIHRAVTKGLDPSVPMKDSGVPWIGEVPEHWAFAPIYSRYEVQLGKMLDASRTTGDHLAPYLRNANIQWDSVDVDDLKQMDFSPADRSKYSLIEGDILMCEGGANANVVGKSAVWDGRINDLYYQKALHRIRRTSTCEHPRFLMFSFWAASSSGAFVADSNANIYHLTAEKLRVMRVPFPPPNEQERIVGRLDRDLARVGDLECLAGRQIDRFREYRQALITAAVTGQLDLDAADTDLPIAAEPDADDYGATP